MSSSHFLRVERDGKFGSKHYIVHVTDPRFSMELTPDRDAPDKIGKGVIKRICLPNSWAGDYSQTARLITAAQDFFARTMSEPGLKSHPRQLGL
ncbi:MAG: hypothetical protein H7A44_03810 [Opitutaceae bacterium]|jgi:hypothetical protein|nr:hypothetical protein [Cephaloticoccus sp.]MCP5529546.1 hypothetical protein [Opitutaceae bacterium]